MAISSVANKAELVEVNKAVATDWFSANLVPNAAQQPGEMIKFMLQVHVNTTTVVNIHMDFGATEVIVGMNGGTAIPADVLYQQEIMIPNSCTGFNIRHVTATQDVSVWVGETRTFDSIL